MLRIGIPRAVFYFDYYPFWAGFFHSLGLQTEVSPKTNRKIMELGLKKAADDTCLPIKLLVGHLQTLNNVDAVFLPRMVSMEEKTYLCPKFLGLPESVMTGVSPEIPLLTVNINWREGRKKVEKDLSVFLSQFGFSKKEARQALNLAEIWQSNYAKYRLNGLSFEEAIKHLETHKTKNLNRELYPQVLREETLQAQDPRPTIALVGHPYLMYETYANLNLIKKLQDKVNLKVIEDVSSEQSELSLSSLRKKMFWSHGKKIMGAGLSFVEDTSVDGIIYLSCFGCGTDSMTQDIVARQARAKGKPYMVITLDEHSGEAGLITRLEAYIDMLERRTYHETDVSAHG